MIWWWFWYKRYQMAKNGETIEPATFSQYITALCILSFLALAGVIMFAIILFFIFFPNTGSYDEFYPYGTINCYISGVSDTDGYNVILISENDGTVLTAPVTKSRFQEMEYLYKNEPSDTMYCLNTYRSGTYDMFISTYDDQTTEEAWEDYKQALQDNSIHKNTAVIVVCCLFALLFLGCFIGLLDKIIKEIGNHKRAKAIEASVSKEQDPPDDKTGNDKDAPKSGLPLVGSTSSTPGLPPMGTLSSAPEVLTSGSEVETQSQELPSHSVSADSAQAVSDLPAFEDELSDEIDAFDPGNVSWHK
ncbi:MAG: hypothetical protein IK020_11070 [Clostridiales bacterium]|nr:hypothetical protein [Clostridiales bacterium]